MQRRHTTWLAAIVIMLWMSAEASAGSYIIYAQGRSWGSWKTDTASVSGYSNITLAFEGNKRINSSATTTVKNAIASYCSGGNGCIVHCYSAGCLRTLKAVSDLRSGGNTLPGLLWVEASGSAAGGSELAELATSGGTKYLAKLIGQQEAVDWDLTPSAARNNFPHSNLGATMYHVAGKKDLCKKLWFVKICAGLLGALPGTHDGVVAMHSAAGYSTAGSYTYGCSSGKYPYHTYDSGFASCYGENVDHFGIPGVGNKGIDGRTHDTSGWSDPTGTASQCSGSQCDQGFNDSGADFSKTVSGSTIATNVSSKASATTPSTAAGSCYGKCGGSGGNGCYCDTSCSTYGDCCSDYSAACSSFAY